MSNCISYIRKWNGLQHFESRKIKYAPKSFENGVYKQAVPSGCTLKGLQQFTPSECCLQIKSQQQRQLYKAKHNTGFWLYGSSERCPNSATCDDSYIQGSAQSADGLRFVVSECVALNVVSTAQVTHSRHTAVPVIAQSYVGAAQT